MNIGGGPGTKLNFQLLRKVILEDKYFDPVGFARIVQEIASVVVGILWSNDSKLSFFAVDILYDISVLQLRIPTQDAI
jgi:hypothetical protein